MHEASLAQLISPITVDDFFEQYWEKKHLHIKRSQENYFDKILSVNDLDAFLSQQNLIPDGMRIIDDGIFIDKRHWTNSQTLLDGTIRVAVSPEKVMNYFQNGATIIINSAEKTIPKLGKACMVFENDLNISVQANVYITPPNAKGFKLHYDLHDIVLMQIKGPKTWNIYDSGEQLPSNYAPFTQEPKLIETITINSGDFFYMPRGTVHEAFSSEEATIHLNFSFKPRYGYHIIEDLAKLAEKQDVFFRRTIPNKYSTQQQKDAYIEQFATHLSTLIEKTPPEELLKRQLDLFNKRRTVDFGGIFINALALEMVKPETLVQRKKGLEYSVLNNNGEINIQFLNRKIIVPRFVESDIFFTEQAFEVREIKGLISEQGKVDLIKNYIYSGFLELTTNEV